jgi:hypothetical protein
MINKNSRVKTLMSSLPDIKFWIWLLAELCLGGVTVIVALFILAAIVSVAHWIGTL